MEPAWLSDAFREIQDAEEEAFVVFSHPPSSTDLGMIDPKASTIEVEVAGSTYTIKQSPTLLRSNRDEGTTGAVAWKSSVLFAEWIINLFDKHLSIKAGAANFVELGCGVSGVVALALSPIANKYLATDQNYVRKLFEQNVVDNKNQVSLPPGTSQRYAQRKYKPQNVEASHLSFSTVSFAELDWHAAEDTRGLRLMSTTHTGGEGAFDFILANDCVYNESLIGPFVNVCASLCRLQSEGKPPALVLVGQQLRSHPVYETWLANMMLVFRVWTVELPLHQTQQGTEESLNFVCHVAMLREMPED